jgi:uncharacterized coiled-coil protein SlyX
MEKIDFNEMLKARIQEAEKKHAEQEQKAIESLLENEAFIEAQRSIMRKEQELQKLNTIITQLNSITPFVAKDGRKFSVIVFPIPVFGTGGAQIMGIIQGSRSAFIDEKALEYSAICGITQLELVEAREAMGSPAYFRDGRVIEAIPGDFNKLSVLLEGIYLKMGLREFKASDITKEKYDLWFALGEAKALRQEAEHKELKLMEKESCDFILED